MKDDRDVLAMFRVDGRVALVTGGSSGLGKSMALALAQAGATTILCARDADECDAAADEIGHETDQTSVGIAMDVTDEEQVQSTFRQAADWFGRVDILINSAGVNIRHPVDEYPLAEFDTVVDTNLKGSWLCCREAVRVMKDRKSGSIVNVGSALSAIGLAHRTPYCASKAGILGLTRTLALEVAPFRIRCNALCPGPFLTEINQPIAGDPEKTRAVVGGTALNRWAELHEIRGAALFLASDASSYMTGAALYVDGGWTAQ